LIQVFGRAEVLQNGGFPLGWLTDKCLRVAKTPVAGMAQGALGGTVCPIFAGYDNSHTNWHSRIHIPYDSQNPVA